MLIQAVDMQDTWAHCSECDEHAAAYVHVEVGEYDFDLDVTHTRQLRDELTRALAQLGETDSWGYLSRIAAIADPWDMLKALLEGYTYGYFKDPYYAQFEKALVARARELVDVHERVPVEVRVLESFRIVGRGLVFVVQATDPPIRVGQLVKPLDGDMAMYRVTGVEMAMSNPPRPVTNGRQGLLVRPEGVNGE